MDLRLDPPVLVWFAARDARLGQRFLSLLPDTTTQLFVSAITAPNVGAPHAGIRCAKPSVGAQSAGGR